MKRLLWIIPILAAFCWLDHRLSDGRTAGNRRGSVTRSLARLADGADARILVLGSSTTAELLKPPVIAAATGRTPADVVMGQINGCHHGCTWAEARHLRAAGRRFEAVFVGVNLFQQCEHDHSKRVMQQLMMTPAADLPRLLATWRHAEQPLRTYGRAAGMALSGAYADTRVAQYRLGAGKAFRPPRGRWFAPGTAPPAPTPGCEYGPKTTALKAAFTAGLLETLSALAPRVTLVLLPDRGLAGGEPAQMAQLPAFRALIDRLAAPHPAVEVLDLIAGNPITAAGFRDGIHLTPEAVPGQVAFFHKQMAMRRP